MKKKIFSGIFAALFFVCGVAFAFNAQDDTICEVDGHTSYRYTGPNAEPSLPLNPLETGLSSPMLFGTDFECQNNPQETCHWVYNEPTTSNPDGSWTKCTGDYEEINP